jgi:CIC family chloride channel protein
MMDGLTKAWTGLGSRRGRASWLRLARPFRLHLRDSQPLLILLCVPLGAIVGLLVVLMHEAVALLHWAAFGIPTTQSLSASVAIDPLRVAMVPAAGGLLLGVTGVLLRRFRSNDVVDPIEANALYGGRMSFIDSIRVAMATILSNGAGASLGLEAAFSQIGAGFMSVAGRHLQLRRADMRVFVGAGAGAAIAAAFNAPLAGAFYAFELVLGSYSPGALAQVGTAALAGTLVVRGTLGIAPIFMTDPQSGAFHQWDYPLFALLGIGASAVGIVIMRAAVWFESRMRRFGMPDWIRPALGGALISLLALVFPQVLGGGHGAIQWLFLGTPWLPYLLMLLAAKIIATVLSIGSGFRGGLFSASLFVGCLYGVCAVRLVSLFGSWFEGEQMVFILVGMGAVAAAIVGAPITIVLLVLEATGNFNLTLAVLTGVVVATTITNFRFGYSFATWRFHQRGKPIRSGVDIGWLSELKVAGIVRTDVMEVGQGTPLLQLRRLVPLGSRSTIFAVDEAGNYAGQIDVTLIHDPDLDDAADGLVASDLAVAGKYYLRPEMDVRTALGWFEKSCLETLPVFAGEGEGRVIGYVTEAYALKSFAYEMERHHSSQLGLSPLLGHIPG